MVQGLAVLLEVIAPGARLVSDRLHQLDHRPGSVDERLLQRNVNGLAVVGAVHALTKRRDADVAKAHRFPQGDGLVEVLDYDADVKHLGEGVGRGVALGGGRRSGATSCDHANPEGGDEGDERALTHWCSSTRCLMTSKKAICPINSVTGGHPHEQTRNKSTSKRPFTTIAATAVMAGTTDVCCLFISPIIVGDGKCAFPSGVRLELALQEERRFHNVMVYLHYHSTTTPAAKHGRAAPASLAGLQLMGEAEIMDGQPKRSQRVHPDARDAFDSAPCRPGSG
jgi:hypothetical protein